MSGKIRISYSSMVSPEKRLQGTFYGLETIIGLPFSPLR